MAARQVVDTYCNPQRRQSQRTWAIAKNTENAQPKEDRKEGLGKKAQRAEIEDKQDNGTQTQLHQ